MIKRFSFNKTWSDNGGSLIPEVLLCNILHGGVMKGAAQLLCTRSRHLKSESLFLSCVFMLDFSGAGLVSTI